MKFCWFTSYIGYPNFFKKTGNSSELGKFFIKFAEAALNEVSYTNAKGLFPSLDHAQVETKKAAFQEYGLLYVIPRSNRIILTPAGKQVYDYCTDGNSRDENRHKIFLVLSRALARYQFNNPLPVGGSRGRLRAEASNIRPYLFTYNLLMHLDGVLTVSELRGLLFGVQKMEDISFVVEKIRKHRKQGKPFTDLDGLPPNKRTADNLKIYFMSHLSLDGELLTYRQANAFYGQEQLFELSEFGAEIIESVLNNEWPTWKATDSKVPVTINYDDITMYFNEGVGQNFLETKITEQIEIIRRKDIEGFGGIVDVYDIENLKTLAVRKFVEGRKRIVTHTRIEKLRNSSLIKQAKKVFKTKHGRLFCEVCNFEFEKKYGKRGKDYIEAHHLAPISTIEDKTILMIEDIGMVCSNCHRMLHRPPWISIERLRKLLI